MAASRADKDRILTALAVFSLIIPVLDWQGVTGPQAAIILQGLTFSLGLYLVDPSTDVSNRSDTFVRGSISALPVFLVGVSFIEFPWIGTGVVHASLLLFVVGVCGVHLARRGLQRGKRSAAGPRTEPGLVTAGRYFLDLLPYGVAALLVSSAVLNLGQSVRTSLTLSVVITAIGVWRAWGPTGAAGAKRRPEREIQKQEAVTGGAAFEAARTPPQMMTWIAGLTAVYLGLGLLGNAGTFLSDAWAGGNWRVISTAGILTLSRLAAAGVFISVGFGLSGSIIGPSSPPVPHYLGLQMFLAVVTGLLLCANRCGYRLSVPGSENASYIETPEAEVIALVIGLLMISLFFWGWWRERTSGFERQYSPVLPTLYVGVALAVFSIVLPGMGGFQMIGAYLFLWVLLGILGWVNEVIRGPWLVVRRTSF